MLFMRKYLKEIFGAQRFIDQELEEYFENLEAITPAMREAVKTYLSGDLEKFFPLFQQINDLENRMDALRRDIESLLYGRRLLPDTRGDILGLLENLDRIPNRIQATIRELRLQKILIPERLHGVLTTLADRGVGIVHVLVKALRAFLSNPRRVREVVKEVSRLEHEADLIEHEAVAATFDDRSLELSHKMQLRYLIDNLGSICDITEDVGDRIMICALKRLL